MHARPAPKRKKSLTSNFSRSTVLLSPHTRRVSSSFSFSPRREKGKNLSRLNDPTERIECVLNASHSLSLSTKASISMSEKSDDEFGVRKVWVHGKRMNQDQLHDFIGSYSHFFTSFLPSFFSFCLSFPIAFIQSSAKEKWQTGIRVIYDR